MQFDCAVVKNTAVKVEFLILQQHNYLHPLNTGVLFIGEKGDSDSVLPYKTRDKFNSKAEL